MKHDLLHYGCGCSQNDAQMLDVCSIADTLKFTFVYDYVRFLLLILQFGDLNAVSPGNMDKGKHFNLSSV